MTHHRGADGPGPAAHRYELTAAAETLFPKRYGDLTTELLGYLGRPGSDGGRRPVRPAPASAGWPTPEPG